MGLLDRLATRRLDVEPPRPAAAAPPQPPPAVFATKALRKFLASLVSRESPVLLDLGPVVGSNVNFFGEQLGCKILVEDVFADVERLTRADKLEDLPDFLRKRFPQGDAAVDGILCWDVIDYLDRNAAQALAEALIRVLRPDGAPLAFFGTSQARDTRYTKYVVVDEVNLQYRSYPASRGRRTTLVNRDILR